MYKGIITVNLMPYREKQKKLKVKKFLTLLIAFGLFGLMASVVWKVSLSLQIDNQNSRNDFLAEENKKLDSTIKSIEGLKEEIKRTLAKRKVVEGLQVNRSDGINIVNAMANSIPEDTYLNNVKKEEDLITIIGQTYSNNKVSHYMVNLDQSPIFKNPILKEVKAKNALDKSKQKDSNLSDFSLKIELERDESPEMKVKKWKYP